MNEICSAIVAAGDKGASKPRMGRVLLVAPGIPHSTEGGSSVVFFEYTKALSQANVQVLNLLLLQPDNASEGRLSDYRKALEESSRFDVLPCWSQSFVTSKRLHLDFDKAAVDAVREQVLAFDPDVIVALDIVSAWAAADLPARRKIVWLGDLNFETRWYVTLYARREGNLGLKHLVGNGLYSVLWAWVYRKVLRRFDSIIVCAKSSERAVGWLGIKGRYLPYPWPQLSHKPRDASRLSPTPSLLFFGGLGGLGSRSAFHFLMDGIYPLLIEAFGRGGFRIVICGRGDLPEWTQREIDARPEIDFQGYIENLDAVMDECHALLAPIDVPVGNRTRILTAISRHFPVIAHRNTALGNPDLVDGQTCYLAGTPEEFVDRIRRTVENPSETRRIVETAYRSYRQSFGPENAIPPVLADIERGMSPGHA